MKLIRLDENQEVYDELFGFGKKKNTSKSKGAVTLSKNNVQREVFNAPTVKKWLSQSRYTGKDLANGFQGINSTAQFTVNNRNIGVALYHNRSGNAMAVAVLGSGDSVSDLWVKANLFSGDPSWSRIMDAFLNCETMRDVEQLFRKYKFDNHKTY